MLKIYGADLSSPSNKVRMAANKLGLKYEYILVELRNKQHKEQWFLDINPVGKIPVIDDNGFILFESDAIIKYLAKKQNSEIYPSDLRQQALIDQWMDFTAIHIGGAMSRVLFNRVFAKFAKEEVDEMSLKAGLNFLHRFLPVVDKQLKDNPYIAGELFSLADIALLATLDPAEVGGVSIEKHENIVKWRQVLKKQAFYLQCHKDYGEKMKEIFKGKI
ncbi:MAG: hypothetical protein A2Y03_04540 [Omnitrophica WOR_2 bacterium GWF2_38_59]|nr:MAG: hypothetical protein A2Y03_04540 [Omnitrophica WOR_2 bacterium GWF2_38_59]OGX49955.1 MAG: hypothetical protein A2243_11495 [Omnitrophica WOR_2 bacterium RIFOXYA2_FULL_38_17]OGX53681.1 MAG: hypothetical protein A2267_10040 [Omnitrophica WOR_2 bacterium RIFOXYA12_FULL_38_10]OGX56380.1 MAG: hypothetical protein A2306_00645 [Omnitrophica WOR_2 bacterium RIFOXYB2_FULL_38_16]OGX58110.1 MAG: hypothetical protein A2447_01325 [Omnitrophica WOR_2 bacterium RIFOXYC2_FULL_38_12]HBG60764.1 hypothet